MHWSRLVDAPIAAIILVVTGVTGSKLRAKPPPSSPGPSRFMRWPFIYPRIGRLAAGEEAIFPLFVVAATTLYYTGVFAPGAIDHHNIQLVLMLAMVLFLLQAGPYNRSAWFAGISAVLMLAIGMVTGNDVAVGGLFVAAGFLFRSDEASGVAAGFGMAFAATSGAVFVATVPTAEWGAAYCDAYSVVQFAIGALAGAGARSRRIDTHAQCHFRATRGIAGDARRRGGVPCIRLFPAMPQRSIRAPRACAPELLAGRNRRGAASVAPFYEEPATLRRPLRDRTNRAHRAGAAPATGTAFAARMC